MPVAGGFVRGSVGGCAANIAEADPMLAYRLAALRLACPQCANHVTATQDQLNVLLYVLAVCAGTHLHRRRYVGVVKQCRHALSRAAARKSTSPVSCSLHAFGGASTDTCHTPYLPASGAKTCDHASYATNERLLDVTRAVWCRQCG